jgi:hypothetical protein
MMVSVPIVSVNYVDVDGYMMMYTIDDSYQNFKFKIRMRDNQTLYDVREELQKIYGWNAHGLIFTWVHDK